MMASNIISRLLPTNPAGRSIYDDLRAHDEASESDIEEQAGMAIDEENLGFRDDELVDAEVFTGEASHITTESSAGRQHESRPLTRRSGNKAQNNRSKWLAQSPRLLVDDGDDDVPASLLIEGHEHNTGAPIRPRKSQAKHQRKQSAIPGPSDRENRAHWEATQAQQRLHEEAGSRRVPHGRANIRLLTGNPREKAMWRWINITNLDNFIRDVYDYYTGFGIWCILLTRVLDLL
jgi:autophagy-related protein 9